MSYKNIISLNDITNAELSQILEIATEMRKTVLARVKRGPQLLGKTLAVVGDFDPLSKTAFCLATQYLSGIASVVDTKNPTREDMFCLKSMGLDFVLINSCDMQFIQECAQNLGLCVINGGANNHENPLNTLVYLLTIKEKLETLKSVDVCVLGDVMKDNQAIDLANALNRFESRVSVFSNDRANSNFLKEKGLRVYNDINMVVSGADAIVDLGCKFEQNTLCYNDAMGLNMEHINLAQQNVPLLNSTMVFSKEECKMVNYNYSVKRNQATNLVAVTMALLYLSNRN